jgi:hypothetical protein
MAIKYSGYVDVSREDLIVEHIFYSYGNTLQRGIYNPIACGSDTSYFHRNQMYPFVAFARSQTGGEGGVLKGKRQNFPCPHHEGT